MKIVQINGTCGVGSTGKICVGLSQLMNVQGIENYILYAYDNSDYEYAVRYGTNMEIKIQALRSRIFGDYGFNSRLMTGRMIKKLEAIQPDIVHLHNLHSHNCDLSALFHYLEAKQIKIVWTFHDCWAFTGYCTYFDISMCNKWQDQCGNCPCFKHYSWFFDRSTCNLEKKKHLYSNLDMTIVTPSHWLMNLVDKSFFQSCKKKVIYNGIDLRAFRPTPSDFRQRHGIRDDHFLICGVAFGWGKRKGLDVFLDIANRLDDRYRIVLVGTDNSVDRLLPDNVISVHRTKNQRQLAEIYTAADLFFNPTREEVLGLVNIEANACGTPVITFNTGGSPECICEKSGTVVPRNDLEASIQEIRRVCETRPYSRQACIESARFFDINNRFREYLDLYKELSI